MKLRPHAGISTFSHNKLQHRTGHRTIFVHWHTANLIATTALRSWTECKQRFHCNTAEWT